jgi:hypothetical protein
MCGKLQGVHRHGQQVAGSGDIRRAGTCAGADVVAREGQHERLGGQCAQEVVLEAAVFCTGQP